MARTAFMVALLVLGASACGSNDSGQPPVVMTIDPNLPPIDAGTHPDAPTDDGDACAPSGCTGSCVDLSAGSVSTMVNGCEVWQCCVHVDAGGDASSDAGDAAE